MEHRPQLLIVDDDPVFLDSLEKLLSEDYRVEACESAIEALEVRDEILKQGGTIHLYITDQVMPQMEGIELLRRIKADPKDRALCMLLTAYADINVATQGINENLIDFYNNKPIEPKKLLLDIKQLLNKKVKTKEQSSRFPESPSHFSSLYSTSKENILITGGTGFLGKYFISELLEKTVTDLYVVVRDKQDIAYDQRKELAGKSSMATSQIAKSVISLSYRILMKSGISPVPRIFRMIEECGHTN